MEKRIVCEILFILIWLGRPHIISGNSTLPLNETMETNSNLTYDYEYYNSDVLPSMQNSYYFQPPGVGEINITEEEFTEVMKHLFTNNTNELLCSIPSLSELTEMPNIACLETHNVTMLLIENMRKLEFNYEDENAQNNILNLFWDSSVGGRILEFLKDRVFGNESMTKHRVKDLWFKNEHLFEGILFPNVFLGYENKEEGEKEKEEEEEKEEGEENEEGEEKGKEEEEEEEEEEEKVENVEKRQDSESISEEEESRSNKNETAEENINISGTDIKGSYPYNAAPRSWTGNFMRKFQNGTIFRKGNISALTNNSTYLADIQVTFGGENRTSTFIVGLTFLYDFTAYTMCWVVGARLNNCVLPLPGNNTTMINVKNMTQIVGRYSSDPIVQERDVYCDGFDLFIHY